MKHHAFQSNPKSDSQCSHATDTTCAAWHVRSLRSSRSNGEMWDGSIWKPYIYCLEPHMDLFSIVFHAWKNIRSTIILGNWIAGFRGFKVMEIHQTNGCFPGIHMFSRFLDHYWETCHGKISWFFFNGCQGWINRPVLHPVTPAGYLGWRSGIFCESTLARYIWEMKYEVIWTLLGNMW